MFGETIEYSANYREFLFICYSCSSVMTRMTKREIEFIITPDGNVEFTVKGAKGKQCLPIAEVFKMLGKPVSEHSTAEYYDQEDEQQVNVFG